MFDKRITDSIKNEKGIKLKHYKKLFIMVLLQH